MGNDAYIAVGSNLGDRAGTIQAAVAQLRSIDSVEVVRCSQLIETDPVGPGDQGAYLNGVVHVKTALTPRELLETILHIETQHGRDRSSEIRWGARTLDLDLLIFGDTIIDEPGLEVPHPRMHERSFVLIPLCELVPDLVLVLYKKTPREMLEALSV
jgi:2-amino-4-hydroxy-6-hydroxymethyldihydropteridine diphosphokinase